MSCPACANAINFNAVYNPFLSKYPRPFGSDKSQIYDHQWKWIKSKFALYFLQVGNWNGYLWFMYLPFLEPHRSGPIFSETGRPFERRWYQSHLGPLACNMLRKSERTFPLPEIKNTIEFVRTVFYRVKLSRPCAPFGYKHDSHSQFIAVLAIVRLPAMHRNVAQYCIDTQFHLNIWCACTEKSVWNTQNLSAILLPTRILCHRILTTCTNEIKAPSRKLKTVWTPKSTCGRPLKTFHETLGARYHLHTSTSIVFISLLAHWRGQSSS